MSMNRLCFVPMFCYVFPVCLYYTFVYLVCKVVIPKDLLVIHIFSYELYNLGGGLTDSKFINCSGSQQFLHLVDL